MSRTNTLRNLILKAKHAYYYSNEPVVTDAEYDALEDELRLLAPDDPVLALVGSPVPTDTMLTKARHSIPMGSQSKINSAEEFGAWFAKNDVKAVHASLKADGASAAAYYRNGQLVQAISRGDGTMGEDITANALRFKGLPAWVGTGDMGFSGAVRFEVILTVEDWTKIDPSRSKNPRNAGTGIMGRKNGHQSDCLTIFAFDLDEMIDGRSVEFSTEAAKATRLLELGFNIIPYAIYDTSAGAIGYFHNIAQSRNELPLWIDGVVMKVDDIVRQRELGVTSGRPKGQIAWKFDSSGAESVLEGVVVSGGHTGGLYPTAQLRPVEIGGTTVSNASLANYDEIERLGVAIGDSVWVVKANDIIPKIIRVTQRAPDRQLILMPTACPFCGGEVGRRQISSGADGVIIECRNAECPKKSTGKIRRWIASLDILGIGDTVLEAMVERFELEDAGDLYTLHERAEELAQLVINKDRDLKLGEKRAASILAEIESTRSQTLSQFLGSLGLEYLGKRRVELMITSAEGDLGSLDSWRSGLLRDATIATKAGVPNIGGQIQDGIDAMAQVIEKLIAAGVTVESHELSGVIAEKALEKTVCISGKLHSGHHKSHYEAPLKAVGYLLVDEVAKGLNFLVLADAGSTSSKSEKARKLGIPVISEEQLLQLGGSNLPEAHGSHESINPSEPVKAIHMTENTPVIQLNDQFQRFEFVNEKSSKFWEIRIRAIAVDVQYGKIGTKGQALTKEFADDTAARKHADKLVAEKYREGYVIASNSGGDVWASKESAVDKTVKATTVPPKPSLAKAKSPEATDTKTLCISGKLPSGKKKADYEAPLRAVGIELVDDVIHGLSYLVLADPSSDSSKAVKARKMGVEVISEDQLIKIVV